MSLQQKLDALRDHLQVRTRADALVSMLTVVEEAISRDQANKALQAPSHAPSFTLSDEEDQPVSLAAKLSRGPVVMVFYRGDRCPGCAQELDALQAAATQFEQLGASLLAVSPQMSAYNRRCVRQHKLGFPILHDAGGQVAAEFGVNWRVPANLRKLYLDLNVDLSEFNGADGWTLPVHSRYLIDQSQCIAYAEINASAPNRMNATGLLTALASLQRKVPYG